MSTKMQWQKPDELRFLLNELVSWKSMTFSQGERQFPFKLQAKLQDLSYFQQYPDKLELHDADLRRKFLTALYKHPEATDTICLISHFDTVNTEEYGDYEPLATQPEELTKIWQEATDELPIDVLEDLNSGDYLFGRGTMDMKMGLVMHMRLIEKASTEEWPINLLVLAVPDEEVNSAGMRLAVPILLKLQEQYHLNYKLFLNSEPAFSMEPDNHEHYIYTGSVGKILPASLFYGKETHAGEPLRGITSPYIGSFLTREMEWNDLFQETVLGEQTPLPVVLQQTDLRLRYSTQTPYRSSALYNIFLFKRSATDIFELFESVANRAAKKCNEDYLKICKKHQVKPIGDVKVIKYKDLLEYATAKLGKELIKEIKAETYYHDEWDDREKSLRITDKLMIHCQELAPAIIILFAPPFYPAVNSSENSLVDWCTKFIIKRAKEKFNLSIKQVHYFNGICDLSYVNYEGKSDGWNAFEQNTPVWNDTYTIPFDAMQKLQAPVLNIGPFGKDPHKRTERLHMQNAFKETPLLLDELIQMMINKKS
ncbi:M20/M25/M40 family metallo-hydrolase [Oceanobacillus halophilus]|uniref:M20/M25/M40 family metallo-hydrolase n=1 Tax=Oceanobacillus halophilus TaxID=930130 RepID=A0A495AB68_9BACI|nr:M20/M25/M40 family metallo-hydrolase [Oceanobacillus halophilus]RKQ37276.1 M20/M25/M40 family metallo-hydrolase [Oceanobacillus halophilus]